MSGRFAGRIAIVTGGGDGIGAATALRLVQEGAAVMVVDKDEANAQAAAREMIKLGGGAIVNVSSHSGLLGSRGRAAYTASKGGIIAMTRVMAVDLSEHNIRVNAIAPGPINTPRIRKSHNEERHAAWLKAVPLARIGDPEEVAAVAAFLASDDASYVSGQTIAVDGGFSAAGLRVNNLEPRS